MGEVVQLFDIGAMSQPDLAEYYTLAEDNCEAAITAMRGMVDELARRRPPKLDGTDRFDVVPDDPVA